MEKLSQKDIGWKLDSSYTQLPEIYYQHQIPAQVSGAKLIYFNHDLAKSIGLTIDAANKTLLTNQLAGNERINNSNPISQAYAGHQFGHFTMLGDGRAILLGEQVTPNQKLVDIQLKGAGQTPFSRRGDGKATLRSMLREYLMSEAMFHLGIPTSRSLAVVSTGEKVYREIPHQGAVLTRLMSSHIRVGTFEYAHYFHGKNATQELLNYSILRHYPELAATANPALSFLEKLMDKQLTLIIQWIRVGFIHGVMNTDNTSIAGETFDYGPCAFMNAYHPDTVFSSIDTNGRYAFGQQPSIAHWNLACLAETLLPLIDENAEKAMELAQNILNQFPDKYHANWWKLYANKLGFLEADTEVKSLIQELLTWMQKNKADYTNTFLFLNQRLSLPHQQYYAPDFEKWMQQREKLLHQRKLNTHVVNELMNANNPCYVPRNHLVEKVLDAACLENNFEEMTRFLSVLATPYNFNEKLSDYQEVPKNDEGYKTYCGT